LIFFEALGRGLSIQSVAPPPVPPPSVVDRVDALWADEVRARGGRLTNGRILSARRCDGPALEVWESSYKHWIAQRRDASLAPWLNVRPLAVSGIVRIGASVALGRRSRDTTQDSGLWDLPPSGGIEAGRCDDGVSVLDAASQQIVSELDEELNVPASQLAGPPRLVALMVDDASNVIDLVFDLRLVLDGEVLLARFRDRTNWEYDELRLVGWTQGPEWLQAQGYALSPSCRALLDFLWQAMDFRSQPDTRE